MYLNLEAENGDRLEECVDKGIRIADILALSVVFSFNGISLWIQPGDIDTEVLKVYMDRLRFNKYCEEDCYK